MFVSAQLDHPEDGLLFLQDEVARVDVLLPPDSFNLMYDDIPYGSTHEFEATFIYTTSFSVDTIFPVGFRLRGNTSLFSAKKSFKVSFNTFESGSQFQGVEKLNLNGEHNDVSVMRAKLCWEMYRDIGVPASRTSHVEVYVNGEYMGIYLNVEHIDEEFIKKRYTDKVGNLYKCLWPATLEYLGPEPDAYKLTSNGRRVYELKTNLERDDYSRFARFMEVLHNTSDEEFACSIERVFNVDDYLKVAALDVLTGNWDGYIVNKNNYYLYENSLTGRMEYIPYDLDNTLGVDWFGFDWTNRDIYNWDFQERPLYERLMGTQRFREQFSHYIQEFCSTLFDLDPIGSRVTEITELISDHVQADGYYPLSWGFSYEDFLVSGDEAWGDHIPHAILPYVEARRSSALTQLEAFETPLIIREIQHTWLTPEQQRFSVFVEGEPDEFRLEWMESGGVEGNSVLQDDGTGDDLVAGDERYDVIIEGLPTEYADYWFTYESNGFEFSEPCDQGYRVWSQPMEGPLFLNELMASNQSTYSDEADEFDDWFELYHNGNVSLPLKDFYATDDIQCARKWQLPNVLIGSDDHMLFWADDEEEQGDFHTSFKLSAGGEELAIFQEQADATLRLVDHVSFPALAEEVSYGRLDDGGMPWLFMGMPTPDASNNLTSIEELNPSGFTIYPNPSSDGKVRVSIPSGQRVSCSDITGKLVGECVVQDGGWLAFESLSEGLYLLKWVDGAAGEVKSIKWMISR